MSDQLDPNDWRVVKPAFDAMFEPYRGPDRWRLRGRNFMTQTVLGFVADPDGEMVEVSTDVFLGTRMFGVTWNRGNDDEPDPRCQACASLDEVHALIYGEAP